MQIIVDNLLVNYELKETPESSGYLVILPGWKHTSKEWLVVADELKVLYKVILLDLPGFGITSPPPSTYDTYDYADFVQKVLNKIGISKCILMGHSFGGRLGIICAAKEDFVEKLILVDPAGITKPNLKVKTKKLLAKILKPLSKIIPKGLSNRFRIALGSKDFIQSGEMKKVFVTTISQNLLHLLTQIKVPTLIIWGDRDDQLNVKESKVYKSKISDSVLRIVWGSGHNSHLEKPLILSEIVKDYLCR